MEWNVSMGGRPLEEIELVDRAKRGDVGAYEELVRMHQSLAARTAYVITGQAADAQDAVQEAFVKAYRSLGRFREGAAFRPGRVRLGELAAHDPGAVARVPRPRPGHGRVRVDVSPR